MSTHGLNPDALSQSSQDRLQTLDRFIQSLDLPSVTPAQFNYLRPLQRYTVERPYRLQLPPSLFEIPATNVVTKSYDSVQVHDMADHKDKFSLDVSGFQFFECGVPVGEWDNQAIIRTYLPPLRDWVVSLLGGHSGLVYSFNLRHHSSDSFVPVQRPWAKGCITADPFGLDCDSGEDNYPMTRFLLGDRGNCPYNNVAEVKAGPNGRCHWKHPFFRVHCDASNSTYKHRLPMFRPEDSQELMGDRVRLVSVWRTLSPHRQDTPLALCDARTVDPNDLVPMDIVYPHFADEVYEVKYNKNHRWFYNSRMTTNDVVILKLSDTHAKDTICPHTAFADPTVPEGTPPRTSIEVKMMIFGVPVKDERDADLKFVFIKDEDDPDSKFEFTTLDALKDDELDALVNIKIEEEDYNFETDGRLLLLPNDNIPNPPNDEDEWSTKLLVYGIVGGH
ncbi:hypothetical protein QBC39DRAFT_372516 [Podospora conica]|nr:hypothetical protein QBC39DRAFT_372516 [Schizothecium conicum]